MAFWELEAELIAQRFGVLFAIISGGVGCVVASLFVLKTFPQLWHFDGDEALEGARAYG